MDALLGGGASVSSVADVQAAGRVERVTTGFRLALTLTAGDRPTVRELEAATCDELAGAAAIAIALLARSGSVSADSTGTTEASTTGTTQAGAGSPTGAKAPRQEARTDAAPRPSREPAPDTATRSGRAYLLIDAPLAVVGWGSLPSAGLGIGAAAGVRWKALRVVAGGELWQPQTHVQSGFSMRFELQSARAEACLTHDLSGVELGPCAGVAFERLSGQGIATEIFSARSSSAFWFSGTGGVVAAVPMPGFPALRILGQASVRVATRRPRFVIDQLGPVHQPAMAAPVLNLGIGWIF